MAIISDIHGNYEALKQVMNEIDHLGITEIYCLGDVVGYYSQVNECCVLLKEKKVRCLMGNHDWYMISETSCERSKSVMDCLNYQKKIITSDNLKWIATFPVIIKANNISMVHGGWNNPIDEYINPSAEYFEGIEGEFFASGHTHKQIICDYGDKKYCNPGSVGQPRDADNRAGFATYDKGLFKLHRVQYDYEKTIEVMRTAGFSDYYSGCLRDGAARLHA